MTIWNIVNLEAEEEHRFDRNPYDFAMKHLWEIPFAPWKEAPYYAFGRDITHAKTSRRTGRKATGIRATAGI